MKMRETPCPRCGWKFPGFHACADLSKIVSGEGASTKRKAAVSKRLTEERNKEIVEKYAAGASYRKLAEEFQIDSKTIARVIQKADAEGKVTIRPRGSQPRELRNA